jgi:hypothetical protein
VEVERNYFSGEPDFLWWEQDESRFAESTRPAAEAKSPNDAVFVEKFAARPRLTKTDARRCPSSGSNREIPERERHPQPT